VDCGRSPRPIGVAELRPDLKYQATGLGHVPLKVRNSR